MAQASLEDVNCSIAEESAQQDGKTSETVPFTAKVSSDQHILKLTRMHPELVTALGLPTTLLAADSIWPVNVDIEYDIKYTDVRDTLDNYVDSILPKRMPRDEACKAIVNHFLDVYPKYNIMIVFSKHIPSFDKGCLHFHLELPTIYDDGTVCTLGYDLYVFKHGWFTLLGDGGYDNWCFGGNFKRDGKSVQFFDP